MAPNNPLTSWGNDKTMNLNTLILTNIQSSPYFKVQLFELKTFHEVVDEIYYKVDHLEPWEKGSRKTAGQTGMCGGVRGVGAGGIVSSAYCLLFKLFTLKLTKKQVNNLITHSDSPYIRGLGFMYIRYSQPPSDLWDWYESYLDDDEELDVKAGGGHMMTIGEMLRQWLVKLEWYSTLFPRIPVPIQKDLDVKLRSRPVAYGYSGYGQEEPAAGPVPAKEPEHIPDDQVSFGEAERSAQSHRGFSGRGRGDHHDSYSNSNGNSLYNRRSPPSRRRSPPRRSPHSRDDFSRDLERERDRQRREKERDSQVKHRDGERDRDRRRSKSRSRSRDRKPQFRRSRSKDRQREEKDHHRDRERERDREEQREEKEKDHHRDRERERDREEHRKEKEHKKHKKSHKHKDKSRDKERDRSRDKEKDSSRYLKDRERDRSRDREKKYSS